MPPVEGSGTCPHSPRHYQIGAASPWLLSLPSSTRPCRTWAAIKLESTLLFSLGHCQWSLSSSRFTYDEQNSMHRSAKHSMCSISLSLGNNPTMQILLLPSSASFIDKKNKFHLPMRTQRVAGRTEIGIGSVLHAKA